MIFGISGCDHKNFYNCGKTFTVLAKLLILIRIKHDRKKNKNYHHNKFKKRQNYLRTLTLLPVNIPKSSPLLQAFIIIQGESFNKGDLK